LNYLITSTFTAVGIEIHVPNAICISAAEHSRWKASQKKTTQADRRPKIHLITGRVMLSEALQRNAKHEARLSNISDFRRGNSTRSD